ncbi:MAG TPA: ABC transporter permease, partial [Pelovirga sp.]|nr:ABC transporter permease [Pelovirga sp.]
VLFVMPVLLVLVLTLVQDNVFRATGETTTRALFVNLDAGELGVDLASGLSATGMLELVEAFAGEKIDLARARQAVFRGNYQFAIVVPADFSVVIAAAAESAARATLRGDSVEIKPAELQIFFDPAVRGVYRTAVSSSVQRGVISVAMANRSTALMRLLSTDLQQQLDEQLQPYGASGLVNIELPEFADNWLEQPLIELQEESAAPEKFPIMPTSVQQNVPAWTLFGMFFIVIPLAGTMIRERQDSTLTRLLTMPVSIAGLLGGKVFAYLFICLLQLVLMLLVGRYLMPLLGTPQFDMGTSPRALALVAVSSALAACGFGMLVGVVARSFDQAAIFGSVSVVIAAALGGVMVPVYMMPQVMQAISVVSPLGWGLEAFLDIFVRGGDLSSVLPQVLTLNGFFLLCMVVAALVFRRWRQGA